MVSTAVGLASRDNSLVWVGRGLLLLSWESDEAIFSVYLRSQ